MNRISFLKRLLATLFGAAIVRSSSAAGSQAIADGHAEQREASLPAQPSPRYLLSATIAGKHYYDFPKHGAKLLVDGEDLYTSIHSDFSEHPAQLVAEPDNPFDFRAIAVYHQGHKMGYLPRKDNKIIYNLLKDGAVLEAKLRLHIHEAIEPDHLYSYDFEQMYDMRIRVYLMEGEGVADLR